MRKHLQKITALCLTAVMSLTFAACSDGAGASGNESKASQAVSQEQTKEPAGELSSKITMAGSTSMEKLANALAESFMEENQGVTVTAEFTGSSAGIESLLSGSTDIGNASRELKDSEKSAGAVENVVAIDGIAAIVHPQSSVTDLTKEQLAALYKGEITNWSKLGGADEPVGVVGREAGSGTRGAFEEILGVEDACKYALELDSTGTVVAKVAATPGAIGYVSLDMIDDTVLPLTLDGVAATADDIKAGRYFLSRPFVMATKGEVSEQSEAVQALFDYIHSDAGTELIESIGLISTK